MNPHTDLLWFYRDSASELGLHAVTNEPVTFATMPRDVDAAALSPGWVSPPVPTRRMRRAAARQSKVRAALLKLTPQQRAVLTMAYQPLRGMADGDIVGTLLARVQAAREDVERPLRAQLREAVRSKDAGRVQSAKAKLNAAVAATAAASKQAVDMLEQAHAAWGEVWKPWWVRKIRAMHKESDCE